MIDHRPVEIQAGTALQRSPELPNCLRHQHAPFLCSVNQTRVQNFFLSSAFRAEALWHLFFDPKREAALLRLSHRASATTLARRSEGSMTTITRRLSKLEDQFGTGSRKPRLLLVACKAGWGLALDVDTCIQILDGCGFLPTGPVGLVNFMDIPEGLNAVQTE